MEYMYNLGITAHIYSIYGVVCVILINFIITLWATDLYKLRRFMIIFTPMGSVMLGSTIFTGIILMASKHIAFSFDNILMIVLALIFIVLEVKRSKILRYISQKELINYKQQAYIILGIEMFFIVVLMSVLRFLQG